MKRIFLLITAIIYGHLALSQNKNVGYWIGTMNREGEYMEVSFEFKILNKQLAGFFYSSHNEPAVFHWIMLLILEIL